MSVQRSTTSPSERDPERDPTCGVEVYNVVDSGGNQGLRGLPVDLVPLVFCGSDFKWDLLNVVESAIQAGDHYSKIFIDRRDGLFDALHKPIPGIRIPEYFGPKLQRQACFKQGAQVETVRTGFQTDKTEDTPRDVDTRNSAHGAETTTRCLSSSMVFFPMPLTPSRSSTR